MQRPFKQSLTSVEDVTIMRLTDGCPPIQKAPCIASICPTQYTGSKGFPLRRVPTIVFLLTLAWEQ